MPKFKIANKVYDISDDQVSKFKALAQTKGYKVEEVLDEGKNLPQGTGATVEETQAPGMEFNLGDTSLDISKGDGKKANVSAKALALVVVFFEFALYSSSIFFIFISKV